MNFVLCRMKIQVWLTWQLRALIVPGLRFPVRRLNRSTLYWCQQVCTVDSGWRNSWFIQEQHSCLVVVGECTRILDWPTSSRQPLHSKLRAPPPSGLCDFFPLSWKKKKKNLLAWNILEPVPLSRMSRHDVFSSESLPVLHRSRSLSLVNSSTQEDRYSQTHYSNSKSKWIH